MGDHLNKNLFATTKTINKTKTRLNEYFNVSNSLNLCKLLSVLCLFFFLGNKMFGRISILIIEMKSFIILVKFDFIVNLIFNLLSFTELLTFDKVQRS